MKKFTFKGVLDGFRQTVQPQAARVEQEFHEQLRSEQFTLKRTFRHGFPFNPTSFAFDPVQKLLAIGDKSGNLRILGRPGVDTHAKHEGESECAVIFLVFLVNEGALVTVTADDTIHLWSIKQKTPIVVQSLKFQRERVTCLHIPVGSQWLYVGTEKGNIHVVNVNTFALSGYIINWNKAMEVVRSSHPGAVIALCDNPLDANKLLIAFECGLLVLWDLKAKCAEIRWQSPEPVKSIAWHYEGKYFVSSHSDGSICTWPTKPTQKPQTLVFPHAKVGKDGIIEKCKAIYKIDLKSTQAGETFTIFSGGMPSEKSSKTNCITVMVGKTTTVLEMEHAVVDFITLCENPWTCETQEPYAIAVLLQYDLVLIDLLTPGFPCFESPYPMDLHESPVTCCTYLTDCPSDLVPAFYSVGRTTTNKKIGFSEREWPICGGEWSPASCSYSEIVITGHQDGSLKFWDSGAGTLQILYKLKTAKMFEKPKNVHTEIENPMAIQLIYLCSESRRLCVAGSNGQVMLFKFRKVESTSDVLVLDIPILYENFEDIYGTSPECDFVPHQVQKTESSDSDKTECSLRVKTGTQRKPPGFQAQIICMTTGPNRRNVQITSLCINSSYGLMAYGTEYGLVVIDIIQKICLMSVACPDLYGAHDPYSRTPKSPKRIENKEEQSRSPSSDQLNDTTTSPDSPSIELSGEAVGEQAPATSSQNTSNPSRPTSPQEEPKSPLTEEPAQPKELPDRRKSMSWKTFNLKRQLSKVNMKIGLASSDSSAEGAGSKNTAVFYTQKECSPEQSEPSSPSKEIPAGVECREHMFDMCQVDGGGSRDEDPTEAGRYEGLFDVTETDRAATSSSKRVEFEDMPGGSGGGAGGGDGPTSRPSNLPLSMDADAETAGVPIKPQRQKLKEKRDQRLLSVPNIKYQMRDIRMRANKNDASPSMGGGATGGGGGGAGSMAKKIRSPSDRRAQSGADAHDTSTTDSGNNGAVAGATATGTSATAATPSALSSKGALQQEQFARATPTSTTSAGGSGDQASGSGAGAAAAAADVSSPGASGAANAAAAGGDSGTSASPQQPQQAQAHHQPVQQYSVTSETFQKTKSQDKLDGTFSRSRSSSVSSIDMSSSESVTCLALIESYVKKNDISSLVPTLWIGTSFGSILTLLITLPERDVRKSQPVLVTINGGPIVRLKGSITSMSFLDAFGTIMPYTFEPWRDESKDGKKDRTPTKSFSRTSPTFTQQTANTVPSATGGTMSSSSTSTSGVSGSISTGLDTLTDRQYIVVASEKQTKVYDIVNQCTINRIQLSEMDFAVKAEIITMKDGTCLATYLSNGHLMVHSLPSLKVLLDTDFLPLMDLSFQTKCKQGIVDPMLSIWGQQIIVHEDTTQISKAFCFSHKGHGLYMASPTEIQKFTISSEFCQFILEMMGELYTSQEMPEQPKDSFFKALLGGGSKSLDREELFGEQSGKANRSVAKHIPGPNVEQLGQRASTAASEISRAHQLAMERGEKLNLLEERAERMSNEAQNFSGTAHQLMLKYKDKKWYQL